ncbi:hypothetical protein AMELA_G00121360 [Ameiurus melas]|uniref:Uncharacterized protein n=1 Tax=Ameiurus melas TaxID=219545 RepID=A0A7J6ALN8_AMEME|nr:hypothetical protein AMELA_G00121360 [Ameiurus melas]
MTCKTGSTSTLTGVKRLLTISDEDILLASTALRLATGFYSDRVRQWCQILGSVKTLTVP